jgi:predicted MFS family arabinose efflux permease
MMTGAGSVPLLCGAMLVTGLAVGPMLVTLNQVAGAAAPIARVTTAMSYLSSGSVIGITAGATAAGALADASGSGGAFGVAVTASLLLLLLCLIGLRDGRPGSLV